MVKEKSLYPVYINWILNSSPSAWWYNTNDRSSRFIPDMHITIDGVSVWIELKHKHKVQPGQFSILQKIARAGGIALIGIDKNVCFVEDFDLKSHSMKRAFDIKEHSLIDIVRIKNDLRRNSK